MNTLICTHLQRNWWSAVFFPDSDDMQFIITVAAFDDLSECGCNSPGKPFP